MPNFKEFNVELIEQSVRLKRFLNDILFTKRLRINEVAKRLEVPAERFYKWTNPDNVYNNLPAYLLPDITQKIGDDLLRYIAIEAGYGIVKMPCIKWNQKESARIGITALKECSEALEVYASAIEDDRVTLRERKEIIKEVSQAIQALLSLKEAAERMNDSAK